jgi:hypothetical protein
MSESATTSSNAAVLCPQCRQENRIATVNGPTCPHQPKSGTAWFPDWWSEAQSEHRRIAHLEFMS